MSSNGYQSESVLRRQDSLQVKDNVNSASSAAKNRITQKIPPSEAEQKPSIDFNEMRTVKYYDKPQRHLEKKHFQQQADIIPTDNTQKKITESDFQSSITYSKEIKSKLSEKIDPKSMVIISSYRK